MLIRTLLPFAILSLFAAATSFAQTFKDRMSDELKWPEKVSVTDIGFKIVREDERNERFIYATKHFELTTPFKFAEGDAVALMRIFETTRAAIEQFPFKFVERMDREFEVQLFNTHKAYVEAGGFKFSGGRYDPMEEILLLSPSILNIRKTGSGEPIVGSIESSTVVKEVTEQVLGKNEFPYWLKEGISKYMQLAPYSDGVLNISKIDASKELQKRKKSLMERGIMSQDGLTQSKIKDIGPAYEVAGELSRTGFVWVAYILQLSDREVKERFEKFTARSPGSWQRGPSRYRDLIEHSDDTTMDFRIEQALKKLGLKTSFYVD